MLNADDDLTTGGGSNLVDRSGPELRRRAARRRRPGRFLTNNDGDRVIDPDGADTAVPLPQPGTSQPGSATPLDGEPVPIATVVELGGRRRDDQPGARHSRRRG